MAEQIYKYLEIVNQKTKEVVKRIDVTGQTTRTIERVECGVLINLNKDEFYTNFTQSATQLPLSR